MLSASLRNSGYLSIVGWQTGFEPRFKGAKGLSC